MTRMAFAVRSACLDCELHHVGYRIALERTDRLARQTSGKKSSSVSAQTSDLMHNYSINLMRIDAYLNGFTTLLAGKGTLL